MKRTIGILIKLSIILCITLITSISTAADTDKNKGQAYYDFARISYQNKNFEEAEKLIRAALNFDSANSEFYFLLGLTLMGLKQWDEALNSFEKVDPTKKGLKSAIALAYYYKSDYEKAIKIFKDLLANINDEKEKEKANYQLGLCYSKTDQCDLAAEHISKANENNNKRIDGYLHLGNCYLKKWEFDKAIEQYEIVANKGNNKLKETADKLIKQAEKQKKILLKPYTVFCKISYGYDDNIRLSPVDDDKTADKGDYLLTGIFSGKYKLLIDKYYNAGIGYTHYATRHNELNAYNLTASIFNVFARYQFDRFTLSLDYNPSKYWVDSKSYMNQHQIKPKVSYKFTNEFSAGLAYGYQRNDYADSNNDKKEGGSNAASLDAAYILPNKIGLLSGQIGYESFSANSSGESYDQLRSNLSAVFNAPLGVKFGVIGRYYQKEYDGIDRTDDNYSANLSVSRNIFYPWLIGYLEYNYTRNDSDAKNKSYRKNAVMFSMSVLF